MIDGGCKVVDFKSNQSDNISISAIVVIMNDNDKVKRKQICMNK
jgi:hypothetical protein